MCNIPDLVAQPVIQSIAPLVLAALTMLGQKGMDLATAKFGQKQIPPGVPLSGGMGGGGGMGQPAPMPQQQQSGVPQFMAQAAQMFMQGQRDKAMKKQQELEAIATMKPWQQMGT